MPRRGKLTPKRFWDEVEVLNRLADIKGARFEGDTPELRLRRKARAIVSREAFGRTYLPHYFRDEGSVWHQLFYRALEAESFLVARVPRGHAKSTIGTFLDPLRDVACGPILRAWEDGTLAESDPALYAEILELMREELERRVAAGPMSVSELGLPEHWDPEVNVELDAWLDRLYADDCSRLAQTQPALPLRWHPYIQVIAADTSQAEEFTGAIRRELELNPLLQSDWGELTPCFSGDWRRRRRRAASEGDFESNDVRVRAFGMEGRLRGGRHGEWRPTKAILDDPDAEESTRTLKQRDSNAKKLTRAIRFGLEPGKSQVVMLGTPHTGDCLVVRFTERDQYKSRFTSIRFRARDESGVALYPARWSAEALDEESQDYESYGPEMDDRPPSQEGNPFQTTHYYSRADYQDLPLTKIMFHDPSYGQSSTADWQATVVLRGPTADGWLLVHRYEQTRIGDPETHVDHVNGVYDEEQPDIAAVDAVALGVLIDALAVARGNRQGVFPVYLRITSYDQGKDVRIRGMATLWNRGIIRLPDDGSCRPLENQALTYGESGSKVDGLDALAEGVKLARQNARGGSARQVRHRPARRAFQRRGAF